MNRHLFMMRKSKKAYDETTESIKTHCEKESYVCIRKTFYMNQYMYDQSLTEDEKIKAKQRERNCYKILELLEEKIKELHEDRNKYMKIHDEAVNMLKLKSLPVKTLSEIYCFSSGGAGPYQGKDDPERNANFEKLVDGMKEEDFEEEETEIIEVEINIEQEQDIDLI
jgi:hypothetical protein